MGASSFYTVAQGKTAAEAFKSAVDQAEYAFGHAGYTGTIAEKDSFVIIALPAGADPMRYANELIHKDDERISDKRGPAGCIALGAGAFAFFGWASD